MFTEAHHHPARGAAGRIGRLIAFSSLCVLAVVLLLCAEASAAPSVTGALDAVAQATPQQLSSAASTTVGQVDSALPSPSAPQPASPAQQPASAPAGPPPAEPRDAGIAAVVHETRERIAPTSDVAGGAGLRPIVHTATAATRDLRVPEPVRTIVHRVSSSRVVGVAGDVTHLVAQATGTTQIVQTLTDDASALTAAVPRGARPGGSIGKPADSPTGPTPLRTIEGAGGKREAAPAQQQALAAAAGLASLAQSAAWEPLVTTTPLVQADFGRWTSRAGAASAKLWPLSLAQALRPTLALARGQSAVSSPARGAHPAPLPASPTPTPSPGGVSPAAAVGAGAGLSTVSLLAALLMLAAPLARRRLRLDVESWRLSPLHLTADRPG